MQRKWLIALVVVLVLGSLLVSRLTNPPPLPPVIILPPTPLAVKSGRIPDRWIPAKWTWLHKACWRVFGSPRQVWCDIQFRNIDGTLASIIAQNSLGRPLAESNGVAAWILPARMRPRFIRDFEIFTANETQASNHAFGCIAEVFPRLNEKTIDLSTRLIDSSEIVAAVRAQVPYGKELLVLDIRVPELFTNRDAIWIRIYDVDAKGHIVRQP